MSRKHGGTSTGDPRVDSCHALTELQENQTGRYGRRIDGQNYPSVTVIVDWLEARCRNYSLFKILHGALLFWAPGKLHVFFGQENQRLGTCGEVFDPNLDDAAYTQEPLDLSKTRTVWPV